MAIKANDSRVTITWSWRRSIVTARVTTSGGVITRTWIAAVIAVNGRGPMSTLEGSRGRSPWRGAWWLWLAVVIFWVCGRLQRRLHCLYWHLQRFHTRNKTFDMVVRVCWFVGNVKSHFRGCIYFKVKVKITLCPFNNVRWRGVSGVRSLKLPHGILVGY